MNINFELYRIFYVVANTGNITKAAEKLLISQPAISKSIKNLEEQLGGKLFVRTKKGVTLTEEGKEFYHYIKSAIEYINNAENKFTDLMNLETGCIRIGSTTTLIKEYLLPYLEEFHKLYPKIDIQINSSMTPELFSKLREGLIDIVIFNLPYSVPNDIEVKKVKEIQDVFIVNDSYKELTKRKIKLKELEKLPLIFQLRGSNTRAFLDEYLSSNGVVLKPEIEIASYSLVTEFTKIGLGIGYATKDYIKEELDNKTLCELDIEPKIPKRHIGVAYSKKNNPSFSTKKLLELILNKTK